ncbi:HAMP domain-containing protein [Chitinivibrio alkaliphilus]|uniref:Cache domain-containing protein n=1 Tax=Chitinivibrio alkaliphilus ACht1 TaxID=1313304 RepID=U7D674_9BACT|nr:cache domain-containing protein [Chitinivibrio alkaliphilus]ERP31076.1 hypothetical protein CALK_2034 [Chitinivibrio alkaliphilus ACht1]
MKLHIHLGTLLFLFFALLTGGILFIFVHTQHMDYDSLLTQQGKNTIHGITEHTALRISELLKEPALVNYTNKTYIRMQSLYDENDLSPLEPWFQEIARQAREHTPQISTVNYGNIYKNYLGIRINDDESLNLMVQDTHTNDSLYIYETLHRSGPIAAVFGAYDPTQRPWFAPLFESPTKQWSEVYVNLDEKAELTITHMLPVFSPQNTLYGAAIVDVKLGRLHAFLQEEEIPPGGAVYITTSEGSLLASSYKTQDTITRSENGLVSLPKAMQSRHPLLRQSATALAQKTQDKKNSLALLIENKEIFVNSTPFHKDNLHWNIVVAMPEAALMGDVRQRQRNSRIMVFTLLLSFSFAAFLLFHKALVPIKTIAEIAQKISRGARNTPSPHAAPLYLKRMNLPSLLGICFGNCKIENRISVLKTGNLPTYLNETKHSWKQILI